MTQTTYTLSSSILIYHLNIHYLLIVLCLYYCYAKNVLLPFIIWKKKILLIFLDPVQILLPLWGHPFCSFTQFSWHRSLTLLQNKSVLQLCILYPIFNLLQNRKVVLFIYRLYFTALLWELGKKQILEKYIHQNWTDFLAVKEQPAYLSSHIFIVGQQGHLLQHFVTDGDSNLTCIFCIAEERKTTVWFLKLTLVSEKSHFWWH